LTKDAALKFIKNYPNAISFVKPSHLEELSPLLEVQIEAVTVRKDEFHDLSGSFSPKKETLDKFAQAAGINYNTAAETTRKDGDDCYVGTTQGMVQGPDGKWQMGAVCEYEFDVDVRLEEMKLKGKPDWDNKVNGRPGLKEYTERELAVERVNLKKVARQRSNTGARSRATLAMLGMQTGFKKLFGKDSPDDSSVTFLFSRIIVNAKNEMVANAMLAGIQGNAVALFGPQHAPQQIAAPVHQEPRPVGPAHEDDFAPDTDFDAAPDPVILRRAALQDLLDGYANNISAAGVSQCKAALESQDDDRVRDCLEKVKSSLERQGITMGGAA
jgi:hypothetical protein